jgi:hypothetical protein
MASLIKGIDAASNANVSTQVPPTSVPTAATDHDYSPPATHQQIDLEDFIANKLPSHVVVTDGQRALAKRVIDYQRTRGLGTKGDRPLRSLGQPLCWVDQVLKTTIVQPRLSQRRVWYRACG